MHIISRTTLFVLIGSALAMLLSGCAGDELDSTQAGFLTELEPAQLSSAVLGEYSPPHGGIAGEREAEDYLLKLINQDRRRFGLQPLKMDEDLRRAARGHSREMIALDYFSHFSPLPGRETCRDRIAGTGITEAEVGENLARLYIGGSPDWRRLVELAHSKLMASPSHRDNLLRENFNYIGLGVIKGYQDGDLGLHITENFATRVFEIDEITVEPGPTEETYLVRVLGRQLDDGYASLQVDRSPYDWVPVACDDEGRFETWIEVAADSGRRLLSLGIGPDRLGHRNLCNEWYVDTDRPPEKARLLIPTN